MSEDISATQLRKNVYKLLDEVLKTGIPIKINRKGKRLFILPAEPVSKFDRLEKHPGCIVGDPEDLVHIDWSGEWDPKI